MNKSIMILALASTCLHGVARAGDTTSPSSDGTIHVFNDKAQIGQSYNSRTGEWFPATSSCVESKSSNMALYNDTVDKEESIAEPNLARSTIKLAKSIKYNADMILDEMVGASTKFLEQDKERLGSIVQRGFARTAPVNSIIRPVKITDDAQKFFNDGGYEKFVENCGDYYVTRIKKVAQTLIETRDLTENKFTSLAISQNIKGEPLALAYTMGVSGSNESQTSDESYDIKATSYGGNSVTTAPIRNALGDFTGNVVDGGAPIIVELTPFYGRRGLLKEGGVAPDASRRNYTNFPFVYLVLVHLYNDLDAVNRAYNAQKDNYKNYAKRTGWTDQAYFNDGLTWRRVRRDDWHAKKQTDLGNLINTLKIKASSCHQARATTCELPANVANAQINDILTWMPRPYDDQEKKRELYMNQREFQETQARWMSKYLDSLCKNNPGMTEMYDPSKLGAELAGLCNTVAANESYVLSENLKNYTGSRLYQLPMQFPDSNSFFRLQFGERGKCLAVRNLRGWKGLVNTVDYSGRVSGTTSIENCSDETAQLFWMRPAGSAPVGSNGEFQIFAYDYVTRETDLDGVDLGNPLDNPTTFIPKGCISVWGVVGGGKQSAQAYDTCLNRFSYIGNKWSETEQTNGGILKLTSFLSMGDWGTAHKYEVKWWESYKWMVDNGDPDWTIHQNGGQGADLGVYFWTNQDGTMNTTTSVTPKVWDIDSADKWIFIR